MKKPTIVEDAFKLASTPYKAGNTEFATCSPIYIAPTSNVKDTLALYSNYQRVLAVGSTGAHGYEALLNGAKQVDLFDVNKLQRLYYEYMKTAIIQLKYEDFMKHFTLKEQQDVMPVHKYSNLLSNELYDKLVDFVPDEVAEVFTPLYDYFYSTELITSALFRLEHIITPEYLKSYVSFYEEENYNKLKRILQENENAITYRTCSLTDVPKTYKDQYDLVILDNILQYYKNIPTFETPYDVNCFIRKKLSQRVAEDGSIQATYGFEVAADAFMEHLGLVQEQEEQSLIKQLVIQKEIKEGIHIPLIQKWSGYDYNLIPGVEMYDGRESKNLVLTYKNNK